MFRILVPLDGSQVAETAVPMACAIASAIGGNVELLTVRTKAPRLSGLRDARAEEPVTGEEEYARSAAEKASLEASCAVFHRTLTGPVVAVICDHARTVRANLIVMTTHGRTGFSRAWLGSVADGVVRYSDVPVLLLRPEQISLPAGQRSLRHFVVPLDGSKLAAAVLGPVLALVAAVSDATLTLVKVVRPVMYYSPIPNQAYSVLMPIVDDAATQSLMDDATRYLGQLEKKLAARTKARIDTQVVLEDRVAPAILAIAEQRHADAIAMTTQGRGASRMFVGSVADKVLRGVSTPLLIFRPSAKRAGRPPRLLKKSRAGK
jgi:nucleotide-binding universal stress UspA family protein